MKEFRGDVPQSKVPLWCFAVRGSIRVSSMALEEPPGGLESCPVRGGRFFSHRHDLGLVPLGKADGASHFRRLGLGNYGVPVCLIGRSCIVHAIPLLSSILSTEESAGNFSGREGKSEREIKSEEIRKSGNQTHAERKGNHESHE
jgi:hypothetical protein